MMRAAESEMDNKEADEIEYKNLFMEVSIFWTFDKAMKSGAILPVHCHSTWLRF
jgi:hypothetical protein